MPLLGERNPLNVIEPRDLNVIEPRNLNVIEPRDADDGRSTAGANSRLSGLIG